MKNVLKKSARKPWLDQTAQGIHLMFGRKEDIEIPLNCVWRYKNSYSPPLSVDNWYENPLNLLNVFIASNFRWMVAVANFFLLVVRLETERNNPQNDESHINIA